MEIKEIARVCHEVNRALCIAQGDGSQLPWEEAAEWQRSSAIRGVEFALANPEALASAQHDAWMADKTADGWTWGPDKDEVLKTHPALVSYGLLPLAQQIKDHAFRAVVAALKDSMS